MPTSTTHMAFSFLPSRREDNLLKLTNRA